MSGWALERAARWGLLSAGFLLPVAGATLTRLALSEPPADVGPPEVSMPLACEPTRLDATCPERHGCVAGSCRDLDLEPRCAAGEGCPTPLCAPGVEFHRGRCMAPDEVDLAPPACRREPGWERTIRDMQRRCGDERHDPAAPLTSCDASLWEVVNRSDEAFESGLLALPGTFSVHFPVGQPKKRGRWPTAAIAEHYSQQLTERRAALAPARRIFVIGRASMQSGTLEYNHDVAERRADWVGGLLSEGMGDGAKIERWGLASRYPLPPSEFQYPGHPPLIAWDIETTQKLVQRLASDEDRGAISSVEWDNLHAAINQVVLVVPIECDGTEFFPLPSFRGARGQQEVMP